MLEKISELESLIPMNEGDNSEIKIGAKDSHRILKIKRDLEVHITEII